MVNIHVAYTQEVNPSGSTPVLTRAQLWAGLQRKVRRAQDFVPPIDDCRVIEEDGNVITREAHFKSGPGAVPGQSDKWVREVCKLYEPTKVDFHQPNGAVITNVISDGPSMDDEDLNMTYMFEWQHDDIEEGSEKAKKTFEEHKNNAKMAVDFSIQSIRRMVAAGEL